MRCQWPLQVARIRLNEVTARDSGTSASITTGMTFINSIVIILVMISSLCSVLVIS